MVTAELFNWTGHVLLTPRTQIAAALSREEARHAGVYLLLGEHDGEPRAYVGESEEVGTRMRQHDVHKEWWTHAVLVTAAANKLNKAHVRYLETRLIEEARAVGRVPLDNAALRTRPSLSEADAAKMEVFLDNLLVVLPAVRVDMFIRRARPASPQVPNRQDAPAAAGSPPEVRFVLESRKHGLRATAVLRDGEFIVEQASTARDAWTGTEAHSYSGLHDELMRAGVLVQEGDHCVFSQNYAFASPSAAAAVIYGRSANGPSAWRVDGQGTLYKDWEAMQLASPEAAA